MPNTTSVEFQFYQPDGKPLAGAEFSVTLRRSGFMHDVEGVVLPDQIVGVTNATGHAVLELYPTSSPYYLQVPAAAPQDEEGCSSVGARYKFLVPQSAVPMKVEDLIVTTPTWSQPWDEVALAAITEAKVVSVDAAARAEAAASGVNAGVIAAAQSAADAEAAALIATTKAGEASESAANTAAMLGTKVDKVVGKGLSTNDYSDAEKSKVAAAIPTAQKGVANGVATLDSSGLVPSAQLPSYVDDVLEFFTLAAMPRPGEAGKIYVALNDNRQYRWPQGGSDYVELVASPGTTDNIGEGAVNRWWTNARTLASTLTGLSLITASVIAASDTVLSALGKLQAQVTGRAMKGVNGDITQLTGLTTSLSVSQGGTGGNSQASAQAGLGLVPVTSNVDRIAGRLLTPGSAGILGVPVPISNANSVTFLGGTHGTFSGDETSAVAANYPALGGAGSAQRRWYIDTDLVDGTSARQTATESLGVGTVAGRTFTRVLATSWQPWVEILKRGDFGIGSAALPFIGTALNPNNYVVAGEYLGQFSMAEWAGVGTPAVNVSGWLTVAPGADANNAVRQTFTNESNGFTFVRAKVSGVWSTWAKIYNSLNALQDAQNSVGLMSATKVDGWIVEKYLNGAASMVGQAPRSAVLPANTVSTVNFTIPALFFDEGVTIPSVCILATANADVTLMSSFATGGTTNIALQIKNGPTAQAVDIRARITGRWKPWS